MGTLGLGAGNTPRGGPQTCVGDIMGENMNQHSLAGAIAGARALGGDEVGVSGGQQVGVGIANDKCPSWLGGCAVSAMVVAGVVVGVAIPFGDGKGPAELERKYGKADVSRPIQCTFTTYGTAYLNGSTVSVPNGARTVKGKALAWSKRPAFTSPTCRSKAPAATATPTWSSRPFIPLLRPHKPAPR